MKYIKEYYKFNNGYTIRSYNDNFGEEGACSFSLMLEDPYSNIREYDVDYDIFLDFIQEIDKNLRSYLINREELGDFESIFGNLELLGFDYKDYLQKYVDENIDPEVVDEFDKEEGGDDEDDEDAEDNDDGYYDDEDEDINDDWWKKPRD